MDTMAGTLKYGKFDKPTPEIAALTGKDNYDVEMSFWAGQMTVHAVLSDNGGFQLLDLIIAELKSHMTC